MAKDKVSNLYSAFVKSGYAMESEAQFRENLKDPKKRKAAYDALVADGYQMEPYADFESTTACHSKIHSKNNVHSCPDSASPDPVSTCDRASTATATCMATHRAGEDKNVLSTPHDDERL